MSSEESLKLVNLYQSITYKRTYNADNPKNCQWPLKKTRELTSDVRFHFAILETYSAQNGGERERESEYTVLDKISQRILVAGSVSTSCMGTVMYPIYIISFTYIYKQ